MQNVRCSKCSKVIGEIDYGRSRFKCHHCKVYTTVEVEHTQQAPRQDVIPTRFKDSGMTVFTKP